MWAHSFCVSRADDHFHVSSWQRIEKIERQQQQQKQPKKDSDVYTKTLRDQRKQDIAINENK